MIKSQDIEIVYETLEYAEGLVGILLGEVKKEFALDQSKHRIYIIQKNINESITMLDDFVRTFNEKRGTKIELKHENYRKR